MVLMKMCPLGAVKNLSVESNWPYTALQVPQSKLSPSLSARKLPHLPQNLSSLPLGIKLFTFQPDINPVPILSHHFVPKDEGRMKGNGDFGRLESIKSLGEAEYEDTVFGATPKINNSRTGHTPRSRHTSPALSRASVPSRQMPTSLIPQAKSAVSITVTNTKPTPPDHPDNLSLDNLSNKPTTYNNDTKPEDPTSSEGKDGREEKDGKDGNSGNGYPQSPRANRISSQFALPYPLTHI